MKNTGLYTVSGLTYSSYILTDSFTIFYFIQPKAHGIPYELLGSTQNIVISRVGPSRYMYRTNAMKYNEVFFLSISR